jgi:hypothetical protein
MQVFIFPTRTGMRELSYEDMVKMEIPGEIIRQLFPYVSTAAAARNVSIAWLERGPIIDYHYSIRWDREIR